MPPNMLFVFSAVSLFCVSATEAKSAPSLHRRSEARIGRQMPPHHEPDAVLINSGGRPDGGFPGPGVFGTPGVFGFPWGFPNGFGFPGGQAPPRNPGTFFPRAQNDPGVGQGGPGFVVGTGVFGDPAGFGQPGVFAVAGGGGVPGIFVPGRNPHVPETPGVNGFRPFFPEGPFVPRPTEGSNGHFPGFYGGTGGRETYDDPEAGLFPMVKKSLFLS